MVSLWRLPSLGPAAFEKRKQVLENEELPLTWLSTNMNVAGSHFEQCGLVFYSERTWQTLRDQGPRSLASELLQEKWREDGGGEGTSYWLCIWAEQSPDGEGDTSNPGQMALS
jgi:hypothetical protein